MGRKGLCRAEGFRAEEEDSRDPHKVMEEQGTGWSAHLPQVSLGVKVHAPSGSKQIKRELCEAGGLGGTT